MKITKTEVLHVAHLARLDIAEADNDRLADQIGTILDYVDTLNQVDTTGVPATSHAQCIPGGRRAEPSGPAGFSGQCPGAGRRRICGAQGTLTLH